MISLILISSIILLVLVVATYFFFVAFVRKNMGDSDDINDPSNESFGEFRPRVGKGIAKIKAMRPKRVETLSFDNLKLRGKYFPNNSKTTAILFHGYRSMAVRDMGCAVELYLNFGFNVLLVDQRSHGESGGRLITFGVKEKRDVITWVDFVNRRYGPEKILLGGMSMGATTVMLAAGEKDLPENVAAVIADCGYTSPADIIKCVAKKYFKLNACLFIPYFNALCGIFGGFSITKDSTVNSLKECNIPVMLIHGEDDSFVPCDMSRQAIKSCNVESRLLTVKKAHHGMSFLVDEKLVTAEIKDFLIKSNCLQTFN